MYDGFKLKKNPLWSPWFMQKYVSVVRDKGHDSLLYKQALYGVIGHSNLIFQLT